MISSLFKQKGGKKEWIEKNSGVPGEGMEDDDNQRGIDPSSFSMPGN